MPLSPMAYQGKRVTSDLLIANPLAAVCDPDSVSGAARAYCGLIQTTPVKDFATNAPDAAHVAADHLQSKNK